MTRATVVLPTRDEAANLDELFRRLALPDVEILVVDDASSDGTAAKARALGARVIERHDERGLASAVLRGLAEARTDVCVVMDADLSHPPESVADLVRAVEGGADVAIGSRYAPGGAIEGWPGSRRLLSRFGTALARPLADVRDPLAGYFCIRRSRVDLQGLRPRGYKILLEILARGGVERVEEVPITFRDRAAGRSKLGGGVASAYAAQLADLYVHRNAWPWRLAKFLLTGASGLALNLLALWMLVEYAGLTTTAAAVAAFVVAVTWNYAINRGWSFRAGRVPVLRSYAIYVLGALGAFAVQLAAMRLLPAHYVVSAAFGIVAGTAINYAVAELLAFRGR